MKKRTYNKPDNRIMFEVIDGLNHSYLTGNKSQIVGFCIQTAKQYGKAELYVYTIGNKDKTYRKLYTFTYKEVKKWESSMQASQHLPEEAKTVLGDILQAALQAK